MGGSNRGLSGEAASSFVNFSTINRSTASFPSSMSDLLCTGAICMNTTKTFVPLNNDCMTPPMGGTWVDGWVNGLVG